MAIITASTISTQVSLHSQVEAVSDAALNALNGCYEVLVGFDQSPAKVHRDVITLGVDVVRRGVIRQGG